MTKELKMMKWTVKLPSNMFTGFLTPEESSGPLQDKPYEVILRATDGLGLLKGYELREGKTRRDFTNAPVKTYRKEKIATLKQCRKEVRAKAKKGLNSTTLQRVGLTDLLQNGV